MKPSPIISVPQIFSFMLGLVLQLDCVHAQERPVAVVTNKGRVTEYYGTPGNSAVIEYDEITNDFPMVQVLSTNVDGHVFDCLLMASQLKAAPKWDPEKAPLPLSPRKARRIAVDHAFADLGTSIYNVFDFEAKHHWSVVTCDLVQSWGWWDHDFVWYYRVGVKRLVAGASPGTPDAEILITMDGKAAPYVQRKVAGTSQR